MKRLFAIGLVWLGCALAWMVLGSTLFVRSNEGTSDLGSEVEALWGPPGEQRAPEAHYWTAEPRREQHDAPLVGSDIQVEVDLEHRRRGLLWFATFGVAFDATYTFENPDDEARQIDVWFPMYGSVYDGFRVQRGRTDVPYEVQRSTASWHETFAPHERRTYRVAYRTRATNRWHYAMGSETTHVRDFRMRMTTDFADVDFPTDGVSPSRQHRSGDGWEGVWRFDNLVTNRAIGIAPPQPLNPGPVAARITFFAPVALLFFFFAVAILARARSVGLHPMHYFFLACSFFAFHLLFAYLLDHLDFLPSFAIASAVSLLLTVTYARLFVGWRFALCEMAGSQVLYLVLFSYTFTWEGFTGLAIAVGAVVTLFAMMQLTGKLDWSRSKTAAGEPTQF